MRNLPIVALAITLAGGTAAAADQTDVMVPVHQFMDGLNNGDIKTALAACASPSSIIDEFPPHQWGGATGCADWANGFDAYNKKNGITGPIATLGKPRHVDITGDRAYVVLPATYRFKRNGKKVTESGATLTVVLQQLAEGWRITAWAWSRGTER
jgi:enoyl reductase-like protein